ncbi:MAG TPA: protoporphyrinogen oxidase [Actinomycetota bacterium]|nr:protoporphyrinogen oxidase [Actinomycetota bacterium]
MSRVVVVGGGVTGLTAAYRLARAEGGHEVTLLEASDRLGGKVWTVRVGPVAVEAGADSFVVRKPWAVELATELGLGDRLVVPAVGSALVWTDRGLLPFPARTAFGVPASALDLLAWSGLRLRDRLRAALDLLLPSRARPGDEALGALLRRRLGPGAAAALVEPLLAGLHAGDPLRLSALATFPELREWERAHGSLLRGARAALRAARERAPGALFATVWGGLGGLVEALEAALGPARVRRGTPVSGLARRGGGYVVESGSEAVLADAVVLATPAFEAAQLLRRVSPRAARHLGEVPYVSTAVVVLVYPGGSGAALPDASGFVVADRSRTVTACTWVSRKWPSSDLGGRAVLRCFVGRAGDEGAVDLPDRELVERVRAEVEPASGLSVEPEHVRVVRWRRALPQYEVGHLERVAAAERALEEDAPGVALAGAGYRGVGIADCVREGTEAAGRVLARLGARGQPVPSEREVS